MDRVTRLHRRGQPLKVLEGLEGVEDFNRKGSIATFRVGRVGFLVLVEREGLIIMAACAAPKLKEWRAIYRIEEALR